MSVVTGVPLVFSVGATQVSVAVPLLFAVTVTVSVQLVGLYLVFATLIVPIFCYRHYLQDKGRFPDSMLQEMELGDGTRLTRRAGWLPYAALALGAVVVYVTHRLAVY